MKTSSKAHRLSGLALAIALLSPMAHAQDQERGWYGGLGIGESSADIDNTGIRANLEANGYTPGSIQGDDQDFGGKIFLGYSLNRYLGLEGSYHYLGQTGFTTSLTPIDSFEGYTRMQGAGLDLVGTLPINDRFAAFAKAGVHSSRLHERFGNSPAAASFVGGSYNDSGAKYGLGVKYDLTDAFSLRAEVERFDVDTNHVVDDDMQLATIGFQFRFGSRPTPPPPVVQAPEPEPEPEPAPPPPPEPVRVTLSADALFDFDSEALRTPGRQELDVLMEDLRGLDYEILIVTGHTDRIGTESYNQDLSRRRAEAVRDYLVSSGIPTGDIRTSGVGESQPVTMPGDCQNMATDALIACLQPDRRVDVEVSGTRDPE